MGHTRLGTLSRTKSWDEVILRIERGDGVQDVARATLLAAEKGFKNAAKDPGVVESVWLLIQIPFAAKCESFGTALYEAGIHVPRDSSGLMSLIAAFSDSVDCRLNNNAYRTDLGELAQTSAAETLTTILARRTDSLFDLSQDSLQGELKTFSTKKNFGTLSSTFFSRFTYKTLDYYLSRTLANHVGPGRRFLTLGRLSDFISDLAHHCDEAARYVTDFSGEWLSKTRWQLGNISRENARDFAHGAMSKLLKELKLGAGFDGD